MAGKTIRKFFQFYHIIIIVVTYGCRMSIICGFRLCSVLLYRVLVEFLSSPLEPVV